MGKTIFSGNEAVARGAYEAGCTVAAAYPGTPSTEILETLGSVYKDSLYSEWAPNEKVALESAIGASIGYFFTCAATLATLKRDKDGTPFLKAMAVTGVCFSVAFMVLQLIPIPGLSGVHFGKESYLMLVVWILLGVVFYMKERKNFINK